MLAGALSRQSTLHHSCTFSDEAKPMNESKDKNKKQLKIRVHLPTSEEIEQVVANLQLNKRNADWLSMALPALAKEVKRAIARGDHNLAELRKERLAFLKSLRKYLMKLRALLESREDNTFEEVLAAEVGLLFSSGAFQTVPHFELGRESIRERERREYEDLRAGPYQTLESNVEVERQFLAAQSGRVVFASALSRLIDRLDEYLQYEAKNKGGSPGSAARRYILLNLIWIHNQLCELHPPRSQEQFLELAEQVLSLLGLSTDGLEPAVRRLLKPAKSRNLPRK
jgi:hypothetical protein